MKMREKILLFCLTSTLLALILQTILFQSASSNLIYSQEQEQSNNSLKNMQNEIVGLSNICYTILNKII